MLVLVTTFGIQTALAHEAHNTTAANSAANKAPQSEGESVLASSPAEPAEHITEFPTLHPLVVHFPIMLIILAAAFQIVSLLVFRREMGWSVVFLALLGAIGAYLASNVFHPHTTGLTDNAQRLLVEHELFAAYSFWLAAAGFVLKIVSQFLLDRRWWSETVVTIVLLGAAVAVALTGHHGAELVHKEGVGPRGNFLEMHDH
jgi:uncharacterized membrane protein